MTKRRQYVCVHSECKNPKPNKMNNIERHVWTQHVRKGLGLDNVSYSARDYKKYVEDYVLPLDYLSEGQKESKGEGSTVNNSTEQYEYVNNEVLSQTDSEATRDSGGEEYVEHMDSPGWATRDDATALLGLAAIGKSSQASTIDGSRSPGTYRRVDFYENEEAHRRLQSMASYACDEEMADVDHNELNSSSNSYEFSKLHSSKKRKSDEMDTEEAENILTQLSRQRYVDTKFPNKSFKNEFYTSALNVFRQPLKEASFQRTASGKQDSSKFEFGETPAAFIGQVSIDGSMRI